MRGVNSDLFAMNNTLETINAAAAVIASSEDHFSQARTVQKRKWGSFWSLYWCFGSNNRYNKRIGHAVLVPEPSPQASNTPGPENSIQEPFRTLPFTAPPSSPASFFQSEPPSATQSPTGSLSLASNYSPSGPYSIFAIGPYAHETQLVSPPVFSSFTTEPSTPPFTPPSEYFHLTTPSSSPEVPFAQLLDPQHQTGESSRQRFSQSHYEFQSYQLYPGSPIGQLISPSSCISGSGPSSPFLEFRTGSGPPRLILDKLLNHEWGSRLGSGSLTPDAASSISRDSFILDRQNSLVPDVEIGLDHRVSFELTAEDVLRCEEKKSESFTKAVSESLQNLPNLAKTKETLGESSKGYDKHQSESVKEFNFDNAEGGHSDKTNLGWSFFPMMRPGFS